jgi:hypothetical protein
VYTSLVNLGAANPNCSLPTTTPTNVVTCNIGQLKSNESREFFLIFKAPTAGTNVAFSGLVDFSEGASSGSPPASFTKKVENSMALTETIDISKHVNTVLLPKGGAFFTGNNGAVSSTNAFSTFVTLPSLTSDAPTLVTDNRIDQSAVPSYSCSPGYFCYGLSSKIEINYARDGSKVYYNNIASGKVVTIILRQDVSSLNVIKPRRSVQDVKIFYTTNDDVIPGNLVPSCADPLPIPPPTGVSARPYKDNPCVVVGGRRDFVKGQKGYYEYEIQAVDNGRFGW